MYSPNNLVNNTIAFTDKRSEEKAKNQQLYNENSLGDSSKQTYNPNDNQLHGLNQHSYETHTNQIINDFDNLDISKSHTDSNTSDSDEMFKNEKYLNTDVLHHKDDGVNNLAPYNDNQIGNTVTPAVLDNTNLQHRNTGNHGLNSNQQSHANSLNSNRGVENKTTPTTVQAESLVNKSNSHNRSQLPTNTVNNDTVIGNTVTPAILNPERNLQQGSINNYDPKLNNINKSAQSDNNVNTLNQLHDDGFDNYNPTHKSIDNETLPTNEVNQNVDKYNPNTHNLIDNSSDIVIGTTEIPTRNKPSDTVQVAPTSAYKHFDIVGLNKNDQQTTSLAKEYKAFNNTTAASDSSNKLADEVQTKENTTALGKEYELLAKEDNSNVKTTLSKDDLHSKDNSNVLAKDYDVVESKDSTAGILKPKVKRLGSENDEAELPKKFDNLEWGISTKDNVKENTQVNNMLAGHFNRVNDNDSTRNLEDSNINNHSTVNTGLERSVLDSNLKNITSHPGVANFDKPTNTNLIGTVKSNFEPTHTLTTQHKLDDNDKSYDLDTLADNQNIYKSSKRDDLKPETSDTLNILKDNQVTETINYDLNSGTKQTEVIIDDKLNNKVEKFTDVEAKPNLKTGTSNDNVEVRSPGTFPSTTSNVDDDEPIDENTNKLINEVISTNNNLSQANNRDDDAQPSLLEGIFDKVKGNVMLGVGNLTGNEDYKKSGNVAVKEGQQKIDTHSFTY